MKYIDCLNFGGHLLGWEERKGHEKNRDHRNYPLHIISCNVADLLTVLWVSVLRTVVNDLTGEVIEIPEDENENERAVEVLKNANILTEYTEDLFQQKAKIEEQYETFRYQLLKAMQEHDIKKCSFAGYTFTRVMETMGTKVDTEKMKKAGIYDEFTKKYLIKEKLVVKEEK